MKKLNIKQVIGQKIRDARRTKGISQEELARMLGISQDYISKAENGKINMSIEYLYDVLFALDCFFEIVQFKKTAKKKNSYINNFYDSLEKSKPYKFAIVLPEYSYSYCVVAKDRRQANKLIDKHCFREHFIMNDSIYHYRFLENAPLSEQEQFMNKLIFDKQKAIKHRAASAAGSSW